MPTPLDGDVFSVHAAMKAYHDYAAKGKKKLIQYWINNNHIPCKKTRFYELYTSYTNKCLPDEEQWMKGSGRKPLLSLQEVEQLVTEAQKHHLGAHTPSMI